jgi:glycosyltransferase involved in cell wall biosynthesis
MAEKKYCYISELTEKGVGFGDYSRAFYRVLGQLCEETEFSLQSLNLSGSQALKEKEFQEFVEIGVKLKEHDVIHIEICRNDFTRWRLLEYLVKNESVVCKLHVTIHDPPEIIGAFTDRFSEKYLTCLPLAQKIYRKLRRALPRSERTIHKTLSKLDRIYCLSSAGRDCIIEQFHLLTHRVIWIPHVRYNIVSEDESRFTKENDLPIVGFMGTWWKHKGIEFLFNELELLSDSGVKFNFWLSGVSLNSKYQKMTLEKVEQLSAKMNIRNFGSLDSSEFTSFSKSCDVVVMPHRGGTKIQGSGILMRALEANTCILASDAPGAFDEAIKHCAVGHFTWADQSGFKVKLLALLDSTEARERLKSSAAQYLEECHSDQVIVNACK